MSRPGPRLPKKPPEPALRPENVAEYYLAVRESVTTSVYFRRPPEPDHTEGWERRRREWFERAKVATLKRRKRE